MATIDIFNDDAFKTVSMVDAFRESEYLPQGLNKYFEFKGVYTETVAIEKKGEELVLIPTSDRGSPIDEMTGLKRTIRDFRTTRLAKGDTIMASELAFIRAFGSETELMQVQSEVAERVMGLDNDLELTFENMRLGAIQGKTYDADGATLIYNWYTEWGVSEPSVIDFDLDNASPTAGALIKKCNAMVREIRKQCKGAWTGSSKVKALVGSTFWDQLVTHPHVEDTYSNWTAAVALRGSLSEPYGNFVFGGIEWEEYQGTDDGSKVAIAVTAARFFPTNVKGNLVHAASPSEFLKDVGGKGIRKYAVIERDPSTNEKWVRPEIYSYPLFYCARPLTLRSGKNT